LDSKTDVFNDGKSFVRLVDWVGDELAIVNAARVSFHNESEYEEELEYFETEQTSAPQGIVVGKHLNDKDKGLINFLLKNKHGSPFEQGFMAQFHIRLPIFVMREWVRHRIGFSINEESARYVEMRPDFYVPDHIRTQHGKPGAYFFERVEPESELSRYSIAAIDSASHKAYVSYKNLLDWGVAKEQARVVLPLNLYTEIRWTCNARSLMNFLALRNTEHAMFEIAAYALVLESIFSEHMPHVHEAFVRAGRIAP